MDIREEKFNRIYDRYSNELYKYVYLRTGMNNETAEEILQDIFTDVFIEMEHFRGLCSVKTWLYRIASNKICDFFRQKYSKEPPSDIDETEIADDAQNIEDLIIRQEDKDSVYQCLRSIPERYQIVLTMRYLDGRRVRDIAYLTGNTVKSVDGLIRRAKNSFIQEWRNLQ